MASHLRIHDIASGQSREVLSSERLIEAPNWTRDGRALIVNGEGRLFRVDLDAPDLVRIDTGFAAKLNNDHGISPDGTTLAISDSTEAGQSAIYLVPLAGGTPRRVTPKTPSWWHGWSPDGARLAYAARRHQGGPIAIATCALDGSDERLLTEGFDHCDGPDYSADGGWIWFNGEREGRVCLWRMRPDGSELERMSGDERAHWFPHPSHDGGRVLYLAYPPETRGHPRDREVELRLMPAAGGPPEVVEVLWGGQGSINVPSWAPDGSAFAFMAYDRG
jgi:Tol biopolymer transport system component